MSSEEGSGAAATKRKAPVDDIWDVEECRGDHESVEHWELRRQFLAENMGRFSKNRLICLSQVFANVEFLGCRYPEETMELVQELSVGIVEAYREKQKSRLQRTFVKASDAAERKTKAKSLSSNLLPEPVKRRRNSDFSHLTTQPLVSHPASGSIGELSRMILIIFSYNPGENAVQIIHRSCNASKIPISYQFKETSSDYTCTYTIGTIINAESEGGHLTKDSARGQAAKLAFVKVQKYCYTFVTKVKVLPDSWGKEIAKDDILDEKNSLVQGISENNIGNKLLKLMGWTGGGLGKAEQGIQKPINSTEDMVVGRNGLGLDSGTGIVSFRNKLKNYLQEHQKAGFPHDLKFSSDFLKEERKEIHMISQKLGLKSKSYGKDDDRYLVISEKTTRETLLKDTLAEGGETDKYLVIPPGSNIDKILEFTR